MSMFDKLLERAEQRAAAAASNELTAIEGAVAALAGVRLNRDGERLVVSGRRLKRRWLDDLSLRLAFRGQR
jgi:hypothetical protein